MVVAKLMVVIAVVVVAVDVVAEGVGAVGALAFCLGRPGSNSGSDLVFSVQNCCQSILTGYRAFSSNV